MSCIVIYSATQKVYRTFSFCSILRSPIVVIGRCLGAFSRAYPDPFLEKQLFGFDLESLLSQLHLASALGSTAGNVLYVVDIVIPVLSKLDLSFDQCRIVSVICFFHSYIAKWYSGNSL